MTLHRIAFAIKLTDSRPACRVGGCILLSIGEEQTEKTEAVSGFIIHFEFTRTRSNENAGLADPTGRAPQALQGGSGWEFARIDAPTPSNRLKWFLSAEAWVATPNRDNYWPVAEPACGH